MFKPPATNPGQKRTLRPIFAQHQATPWPGFLDPNWNKAFDILPGTVMCRLSGEVFTPFTGAGNQKPWGLSEFFVAPTLGIDEITPTATNLFTVWRGGQDAAFEVLAPAFDVTATWTQATDGSRQLLAPTAQGKLAPVTGSGTLTQANAIAELVQVISTDKILINLNRFA